LDTFIATEEKKTPSYLQMRLINKNLYAQSPYVRLCVLLFLTFRFLFGNRLKNIPYRAFYHVYMEHADDIKEQIM